MKELKAFQVTPQYGDLSVVIRFKDNILFIKSNNTQQKNQMVKKMRDKGASILESRTGWLRVNMFAGKELVRLGGKEFDVTKLEPRVIEALLVDFYKTKYTEAKYSVTVEDIGDIDGNSN